MTDSIGKHQCSGCNRFFVGVSSHEAHRMGTFGEDRRCMTDEEMQEAGLASEKKLVRLFVEGKMSLQEQDVWYQVANREAAKNYFRPS